MKYRVSMKIIFAALALTMGIVVPVSADEIVTVHNYARAETDRTFQVYVDKGGFGKFVHFRAPTPIDKQDVIRMNRDTLYSLGVFDLSSPVTVLMPDSGDRFQSLLIINQDHSMEPVIHEAGKFTFTREDIGTRYVFLIIRTFVDSNDPVDVMAATALQDEIIIQQRDQGEFTVPKWDEKSMSKVRDAINVLASTESDTTAWFGDKSKLSSVDFLMGTACCWGANPKEAAIYITDAVDKNDGETPYSVTVKDAPVKGFWSITVYNKAGFMEKNDKDAYNFNSATAQTNSDGSITINFGSCDDDRLNCLPITEGWNYAVRLYQPGPALIEGSWKFPEFEISN